MRSRTRLVVVLFVMAVCLSLAAPAFGILPGRNGRIAFTSGRVPDPAGNDSLAQIFTVNPVSPITPPAPITPAPIGGQSRHASWSPDRTKLVFANGTPGTLATEEYDLFVRDFVNNTLTPLDGTQVADSLSSDHPTWSPDGTKIAYEQQRDTATKDSTDRDIRVKTVGTAQPALVFTNDPNTFDLKPAWNPQSDTLYFARSPVPTNMAGENFDIVRKPLNSANPPTPVPGMSTAGVSEYQPSLSPDGTKICYTEQVPQNQSSTEVFIQDLPNGGGKRDISDRPGLTEGDINCTFSPDGTKVAFTQGIFGGGRLFTESATDNDNTPPLAPLSNDQGDNNFDGNSDWAPDGSPDCPDGVVTTPQNTPVTLQLECTDTGPQYERTDPNGTPANNGGPQNGTLSDFSPLSNPSTVKYTPNQGFAGTDRVIYTAFDDFGFGTDTGTMQINVLAPNQGGGGGGGQTINGTPGNDVINGTNGDDIINCGDGDDIVNAGGGNDIVNCGAGNDRVNGGTGNDRLLGSLGNDRVNGDSGRDRVNGNRGRDRVRGGSGGDRVAGDSGNDRVGGDSGNDRVNGNSGNDRVGGGRGNDRVNGGRGNDRVSGDSGRDRVSGDSGRDRINGGRGRDRCNGGSGRDRARSCERRSRIP